MPTENESLIPITRPVDVLIPMTSYQDMTDAEIELVIQYKIDRAIEQYEIERANTTIEETSLAIRQYCATAVQNSNAMLQLALETEIPWVTIAQDGTVNQNV